MSEDRADLRSCLQQLSNDKGVRRDDLLKLLIGALTPLRRVWGINTNDLILARQTVRLNLAWHFKSIAPRSFKGKRVTESDDIKKYQKIVEVGFNVVRSADVPDEVLNDKVLARQQWLANDMGISVSTVRRYFNDAIDQIVEQLMDPAYTAVVAADQEVSKTVTERGSMTVEKEQPLAGDGAMVVSSPDSSEQKVSQDLRQRQQWIRPAKRWRSVVIVGVVLTLAAVIVISYAVYRGASSGNSTDARSPTGFPQPIAASAPNAPVSIENVSHIHSNTGGTPSFALRDPLKMNTDALSEFNQTIYPNSAPFASWYVSHAGAAVDFGIFDITLRGRQAGEVGISDIQITKQCRQPLSGTFFQGQSAGSGDTIKLGFDLDSPEGRAQEMSLSGDYGLEADGYDYFDDQKIILAHNEAVVFTVGAYTHQHACTFTLQVIVATPRGSYSEMVDDHGKPFEVTAMAAPRSKDLPLSGYASSYAIGRDGEWGYVDPSTYRGH
jgi:hypothetical protein